MTTSTNPSPNAVTGSSGTHPVTEGAADNAPPAIRPRNVQAALELAEDMLSRAPFSTKIWPNGMHPQEGINKIREALDELRATPAAEGREAVAVECNDEIERLRERCEAYKGQVESGAAEIARLKRCGVQTPVYGFINDDGWRARQSVVQIESEPVAWMAEFDGNTDATTKKSRAEDWERLGRKVTPLYTSPVPSAEPSPAVDLYAWPIGCHSPNSCRRNGRCMYVGCKHDGTDAMKAPAISSTNLGGDK